MSETNTSTRSALVDELAAILPGIAEAVEAEAIEAEALRRARAEYEVAFATAEKALEAVAALPQGGFVAEDLAAIRARHLTEADRLASGSPPTFPRALEALAGVAAACAAPRALAERHAAYLLLHDATLAEVAVLTDPLVKPNRASIEQELIGEAATAAAARDHDTAEALLSQVGPRVAAAQRVVARQASFAKALEAAKQAAAALVAEVIRADRESIETALIGKAETAAARRDYDAAAELLKQVAPACLLAQGIATRHDLHAAALATAQQAVATLTEAVIQTDKATIETSLLDAAVKEAAARRYDAADGLLAQVADRVAAAKTLAAQAAEFDATLKALKARLALITDPVAAPEVTKVRESCIAPAEMAAALPGRDYTGAIAALGPAAALCDLAELHVRRYAAGLLVAQQAFVARENRFNEWSNAYDWAGMSGGADAIGITDALATVKQDAITAAETHAAGGRYAEAMRLLESVAARLKPVRAKVEEFIAFLLEQDAQVGEHNAARGVAPIPEIETAYDNLIASHYTAAVDAAKLGDYAGATKLVAGWRKPRQAIEAVAAKWNAAEVARGTLTLACIADDFDRVWDELMVPAAQDVAADALAAATKKLDDAIAQCPRILAYGTALDAAEAAMNGGAGMYGDVATDLRDRLITPAEALAQGWDYPGGAAMLRKVPAAAADARTFFTEVDATHQANQAAQAEVSQITADPDAAVAAIEALLPPLESHAEAARLTDAIEQMRELIDEAKGIIAKVDLADVVAQVELAPAQAKLGEAGDLAVAIRVALNNWSAFIKRHQELTQRHNAVDAVAAPEKAALKANFIDAAMNGFDQDNPAASLDLLARGEAESTKVEELARLALAYQAALGTANTGLATLGDPFLVPDKARIKTDTIDVAAAEALARRFQPAIDALQPLAAACALARDILAQQALYEPQRVELRRLYDMAANNLAYATTTGGLPARADLNAAQAEILTQHLQAAAAEVAGRGLGAPALAAMQRAVGLVEAGQVKANLAVEESYRYAVAAQNRATAQLALDTLKTHKGKAEVAVEIAGFDQAMANATALEAAGQNAAAARIYMEVGWDCAGATRIADSAGAYADSRDAAEARIGTCKGKVDGLAPVSPLIAARLDALRADTVTQAAAHAKARDYAPAMALLATVEARCAAVEALVTAEEQYRPALVAAEQEQAKLTGPETLPEATRITEQFIAPAKAAAARLEHAPAMALLGKVAAAVAAASAIATGAGEAQAARDTAAGDLAGPLPGAISAVEALLAPLLTHDQATAIKDLTDPIADAIAAARVEPPPADAAQRLAEAADACVAARLAAERHAAFARALATAETAAKALTDPLVAADGAAIATRHTEPAKALAAAPGHDFVGAMAQLYLALAAAAAADAILARDADFQIALAKAQALLDGLNALKPAKDPVIGDAAEAIQTQKIDAAKALAGLPQRDHAGAEALLAGIAAACKTLALQKKAAGGGVPDELEIKALIDEPGGAKQLDAMVATLPDTTPRGVVEALIKLRFDLDSFQNLDAGGGAKDAALGKSKSLKKIYALLAMVPDSHTRDNPSLDRIERYGGDASLPENVKRGSYFAGGDKKVVLSCGRAKDADPHPLGGVALALPEVEPECEMVPDSEVPAPKYFDWTTLHEVGHAIDDKKRFMQGKAGDGAFGGWQVHGRDVMPVARAVAKACSFEGAAAEAYLAAYLLGGKPAVPTAPMGRDAGDWASSAVKAAAWCDAIRVGQELWENGGATAAHAVDGRVYHEAYAGSWVSYDLAARTKGITGYQFRAPGEWLSELYAAFHSGKLKKSHPAAGWLETL
jgi:hypothetical protein